MATGVVTYTAAAGAGTASFEYTVATTAGGISAPAVVSLPILSNTDGPAAAPGPGNLVTVVLVHNGTTISTLGTASVDAAGTWALGVPNSNVSTANGDTLRVTSTRGCHHASACHFIRS